MIKIVFELFYLRAVLNNVLLKLGNLGVCLTNLLLRKLNFETLELNFLAQRIIFAIVAHIVYLFLVTLYGSLRLLNAGTLGCNILFV